MEEHIVLINYTNGDGYRGKEYCDVREEIIRCRDCRDHEESNLCRYWSANSGMEFYGQVYTDPDGFCAWAERAN